MPRIPSSASLANIDDSVLTGEKYWFFTDTPATLTVSVYTGPETVEPSPYWMENLPLLLALLDDDAGLYLCFLLQNELVQLTEGTQRSEEPAGTHVSITVRIYHGYEDVLSKSMRNV